MKKIFLLLTCFISLAAYAGDRLPISGLSNATMPIMGKAEINYTGQYAVAFLYDANGSGTGNKDQAIDATQYPTLKLEMEGGFDQLQIEVIGTLNGAEKTYTIWPASVKASMNINLAGYAFDECTTIKGIQLKQNMGTVPNTVIVNKGALVDSEGNEYELAKSYGTWGGSISAVDPSYAGVVTFKGPWAKMGQAAWAPTSTEGKSIYVINFNTPVTDQVGFQFKTVKVSDGKDRNFQTIGAGVKTYTYITDNADAKEVTLQTTDATKNFPAKLDIASVTRYDASQPQTIEVNATGIASFVTEVALTIPEELNVFYAQNDDISSGQLTLKQVWGTIRPGAYFVKGQTNNNVAIFSDYKKDPEATNILKGNVHSKGKATPGKTRYALSNVDGMLHPIADDVDIPAGKAYLEIDTPAEGAAKALSLDFGGVPTAINTVNNAQTAERCYNLAGQQVSANAKGIIVKGGKKYINK